MANKKVPQMTNLKPLIQDKNFFTKFLDSILVNEYNENDLKDILKNDFYKDYTEKTTSRVLGSIHQYNFIEKKNGNYIPTKETKDYLKGDMSYSDLILKCLCGNFEWAFFLVDLYEIIEENEPIKKQNIISRLKEQEYTQKKGTLNRYLNDILQILDLTKVINYEGGIAKIDPSRKQHKVYYYARRVQRELLSLLRKARRRNVREDRIRSIYHATIMTYIYGHQRRAKYTNALDKAREVMEKDIPKSTQKTEIIKKESKWELVDDLWDWQQEFHDKWMEKKKGIAKVVTGAGKTHLAMAILESMKKEYDDLHVTIIVPSIVLLEQWFDNLVEKLQISPDEIGRRGGGHKDDFDNNKVLIVVINSAIKDDFIEKETKDIKNNLFIVDECHRAGAPEFRNIFKANRKWELGLSATPERERDNAFENVLVKELGEIIGTYIYKDALRDGIIPKFDIYNYAVMLSRNEKIKYDKLTKQIRNIVKRLKMKYPFLENSELNFEATLNSLKSSNPDDKDLYLYFQKTKERKEDVVYPAKNRKKLVQEIIHGAIPRRKYKTSFDDDSTLNLTSDDRVMLFHESIDEVNSLFMELDSPFVSIYHSKFPNSLNKIGLELYQSESTNILLSVKALIEGVDVPKANVGIIMASSSSITQRVQSLGRVLRKAKGKEETKMIIPYVKDTTDETIYYKRDWDEIVGKKNIEFKMWTEYGELDIDRPQPKKPKKYQDIETIDENMLEIGDKYPGRYDGKAYSFDHRGKLFEKNSSERSYFDYDLNELWKEFRKFKPGGGKLNINELGHILISRKKEGEYKTIYLGNIDDYSEEAGNTLKPEEK